MGRAPCCDKNGLKKGPWTPEEDTKLIDYIQEHGPGNWRNLPKHAGLERCGKSCRLRWTNYLRPDIKRGRFSFEEEESIIQLHSVLGNKWSAIAARLPGRTDNEIKNYWNTHIRKRLLRSGIDPVTHSPRLDLLDLSSFLSSPLFNPSLLGLSNLLNPELLRLASALVSLNKENNNANAMLNPNDLFSQPQLIQPNVNDQFQTPMPQSMQAHLSVDQNPSFSETPVVDYLPDKSYFENLLDYADKGFGFESVLSTPSTSVSPLNSTSATEDEKDSYSSDLFKFELPESLDISDFL